MQRAVLLRGGTVIDGTGAAPFEADVRISGDRIAAIGPRLQAGDAEIVDVRGLMVAPGFIDIHSHTDTELFEQPRAESKIRQGVTTEVAGQDGGSVAPSTAERVASVRREYGTDVDVTTLGGFFRALEKRDFAVNLASMVGTGTVRGVVIGNADRRATPDEIVRMQALVRTALEDGACGVSSGLEYTPGGFADRAELVAVATPLRGTGLPYASHMRNEDDALLAAIEEALHVGRLAEVPVQISHLKAQGQRNWWKADAALATIERARAAGVDVHFDRYPYIAYATGLSNLFPLWSRDGGTAAFLERLRAGEQSAAIEAAVREKIAQLGNWDAVQITSTTQESLAWARGKRLGVLAQARGAEPYALLLEIMYADSGRTGMVGFGMSEENTEKILAHPLGMICSDGSALATEGPLARGTPHPRNFGTFPRVLGHYVRERRAMSLELAVHKMTAMPAAKLRLKDRGKLAQGAYADIVVFDPATVADRATFEQPFAYPVGIAHVIVNGVLVLRDAEHTGSLPGRVVRSAR
jgi:N-acyl-D-amino-acid deacylase